MANQNSGVQNILKQIEMDAVAASSVSDQIAKLIPYLKYRKEAARKLDRAGSGEAAEELRKMIVRCNEEIKTILGIY